MKLPEFSIDLDVTIVSIRIEAYETIGSQKAAKS
jgi:hypothetical protein